MQYGRPGYSIYRKSRQIQRRRSQARLVIFLLILFAIFYLIGSGYCGGRRIDQLRAYITMTNELAEKSNKISQGFELLKMPNISRTELRKRLTQYSKESAIIAGKSQAIEVPGELEEAHSYLILSLKLRANALDRYKPAIFNALKDVDLEVASGQVALVLKDLSLSDRAYHFFKTEAEQLLRRERVYGSSAVDSKFLKEDTAYEKATLIPYLEQLRGVASLEEVHGIAIIGFAVNPKETGYNPAQKLYSLPGMNRLSITVTVHNQGNQIETKVPIKATIKSETQPREQILQAVIDSLAPNEKKSVTIDRLRPTPGQVVNLLTVTAGPVPKEKYLGNNVREFKFIMP